MGTFNLVVVTSSSPATQLFGGQGSATAPIQIVNLDPTNTLYVGTDSNISIGQPGCFPLSPLSSMAFDGSKSTYGITQAGQSITAGVVPGGGNYSSGSVVITGPVTATISGPVDAVITGTTDVNVQNANIDVLGVGGFITPGQVGSIYNNAAAVTVPANTVSSIQQFNVTTFASVVLSTASMTNSSTAAGAGVCAIIQLVWSDNNNIILASDTLSCLIQGSATWEVPVKGSLLTLVLQNAGTVGTITFSATNLNIDGSFRTIPNIRVVNSAILNTPILTGCTVQTQMKPVYGISSWIANISFSYTVAVTNLVFPLALWSGEAAGFYDITTAALVRNMTIVDLTYAVQGQIVSGGSYSFGTILSIPAAIDTSVVPFSLNLPPTQCAVIADVSAGPGAISMSLIGVTN